jgi:hypothetical protein
LTPRSFASRCERVDGLASTGIWPHWSAKEVIPQIVGHAARFAQTALLSDHRDHAAAVSGGCACFRKDLR